MNTTLNIIISLIILIIIFIYKIIITKKNKNIYKDELYKKSRKIIKMLYILSFIIFVLSLLINFTSSGFTKNLKDITTYIINSLSIALLVIPLSLDRLYESSFHNEEKMSHKKTIVTSVYDSKLIKKFNKAGINVIVLTNKKIKTKIKIINEDEIEKKLLVKNLIIKTDNLNILDKKINKENTYFEYENLTNAYNDIYISRGISDNYARTFKYIFITYVPLVASYFFFFIIGFPVTYNILLTMIIKFLTFLISEFLYKKLPFDSDIMDRKPKNKNIIIGTQELIFNLLISFSIFFLITIPYMLVISQGGSQELGNTIYLIVLIYSNIYISISLLSEKMFLKNILKAITNIRFLTYIIILVILTISINYNSYFITRNIGLHNYISCCIFGIISIFFNELIKLARFTTMKGSKK